jgi:hypothetical protein
VYGLAVIEEVEPPPATSGGVRLSGGLRLRGTRFG